MQIEFNIEGTSPLIQFTMKQYKRHLYDKKLNLTPTLL